MFKGLFREELPVHGVHEERDAIFIKKFVKQLTLNQNSSDFRSFLSRSLQDLS